MNSHGDTRFWLKVMGQLCLIFSPVGIALWLVIRLELGSSKLLLYINNISENSFVINDVLFASIFASYLVVFVGLLLYLLGIINDLTEYSGHNSSVRRLNTTSGSLLWLLWALMLVYLVIVVIACTGYFPVLNVHGLIIINKVLSVLIFGTFLIVDLLGWRSKVVQERELTNSKNGDASSCKKEIDKQLKITGLLKQYAKDATFYVNIPTLVLNLSIVAFTLSLDQSSRLRGIVDLALHHYVSPSQNVHGDVFDLFSNGIETGAIVCTIVFSQIVYMVIKTKCDLRIRLIK